MSDAKQKSAQTVWMIYGAYGYSGELIAREAVRRGQRPVLAGRDAAKTRQLASELGLQAVSFELDNVQQAAGHIKGMDLVINCAGPFSVTARPMMNACIAAKAHYLDITGEIDVFELSQSLGELAAKAGVVLCSGCGFDVIPTDCVAVALKEAMPDATHLSLGFSGSTRLSPGTAKTTVEGMALGGKIRRDGKLETVPMAHHSRRIDYGRGPQTSVAIPWGDVSSAFHSTGIANITVYVPGNRAMIAGARLAHYLRPVLALTPVQKLLKAGVGKFIKGPNQQERDAMPTLVWGEASNGRGRKKTARIKTANGYSVTITGSLAVIEFLLTHQPAGGAYSPASLVGHELVTQLPGSGPMNIS